MAIRLTRTSTQYFTRTTNLININSPYTVMCWVRPNDVGAGNWHNFFFLGSSDSSGDALQLNRLTFNVWCASAGVSGSTLTAGTWYHIAMVRESATVLKAYLDGSLDATDTYNTTGRSAADKENVGAWNTGADYADGRFYALKAWNVALTLAEVNQERFCVLPRRSSNLYGFWPGLPGATERAKDYSGNGYDWSQVNTPTDEDPPSISWGTRPLVIPYLAGGDVTVSLNAATLSASGQAVTASTPVTVNLNAATLTASGQTVTASAGSLATIPAGVICIWPGTHASIPTGWQRVTALDGLYPKGAADATNPGGTGGNNTHSHTTANHTHAGSHTHTVPNGPAGSGETLRDSGSTRPPTAHTHTGNPSTTNPTVNTLTNDTPSTDSPSNEPSYFVGIFIESDGTPTGFPATAIIPWDQASAPAGWTLCDGSGSTPDLRGKYIKGAATLGDGGGTGGAATHTHTIASHTHGTNYSHAHPNVTSAQTGAGMVGGPGSGSNAQTALQTHTHTLAIGTQATDAITGNTDSTDTPNHEPPYVLLGWIQNTSGAASYPNKSIALWIGTLLNIPTDYALCNGTGTVDTRSKFIKGATTLAGVGTTGGSLTHSHTATGHTHAVASHAHTVTDQGDGAGSNNTAGSTGCSTTGHTHPSWSDTGASSFTSGNGAPTVNDYTDTQPAYYAVAWIQYTAAVAPTTVSLNAAALSAAGQTISLIPGDVSLVLAAAALTASGQIITASAAGPPVTVTLNAAVITAIPQVIGIRHRSILVGNGYGDVTPRQIVRTIDNRLWIATWEFDHWPQGTDTGLGQTLKMYKADQTGTPSSFTRMDSAHEPVDVNSWSIAYGGGNIIHVIWTKRASWETGHSYSEDGTDNYVYYCQFDTGAGTWGTPETIESAAAIVESGQGDELCAIAVDAHHAPHIVYLKSDGTRRRVNYRNRSGGLWSSATVVDDQTMSGDQRCWHPGICFDRDGRIAVTWLRGTHDSLSDGRIFIRVYDGSWGTTVDVTGADVNTGIDQNAGLYIDSNNRYHLSWLSAYQTGYVRYKYSDDQGANWTANHPSDTSADNPICAPAPDGRVRIYCHGAASDYPISYWEGTGGSGAWGSRVVYSSDHTPNDCSVNVRWTGYGLPFENRYDIAYWVSNYPTNVLYVGTEVWGADPVYVSLNAATLTASGQTVSVVVPVNVVLNAAILAANGQALSILPGAVSSSLAAAVLSASGQVVTISLATDVFINLLAASLLAQGQAITTVPGDVNPLLSAAVLSASGQAITIEPGAISTTLTAATLSAIGQTLTAVPGAVDLLLSVATVAAQGQVISIVPGDVSSLLAAALLAANGQAVTVSNITGLVVSLNSAVLASQGQTITSVGGPVSSSLSVATLTATGQTVSILPGATSVIVSAATLLAQGQVITPVGGPVSSILDTAMLAAQGQALSVVPGAASVLLNVAALTASGQVVTISAPPGGLVVTLASATLLASGQATTVVPGAVSTLLDTAILTAYGQPITMGGAPVVVPVINPGGGGGGPFTRPDYEVPYDMERVLAAQEIIDEEEILFLV